LDAFEIARPFDQPHRDVEIRLGEIDFVAADQQVADFWIRAAERGEARGEPLGVELARGGDRVVVARLPGLHGLDRFLEPQETLP
jgi:hypothetical protein